MANEILRNFADRICRLIHWTMSSTDREDIYVLVGRNPDIENVGPDRANDQELNIDISNSAGSGTAAAVEQSSNDPKFSAATCEQTSDSTSKHLEGYFKTAPVPLHLLSCDGKIIWANDSELKLVGYHADEYIGHEMTEVKLYDRDFYTGNLTTPNSRNFLAVSVSRRGQDTSGGPREVTKS